MDHVILGLTSLGIDGLLQYLNAQELATYGVRDDQGVLTRVLVATDLGVIELVIKDELPVDGSLHPWQNVGAGLAWSSRDVPPAPEYRLTLSFLADPLPAPEVGGPERHSFDDFRRFVMERAAA